MSEKVLGFSEPGLSPKDKSCGERLCLGSQTILLAWLAVLFDAETGFCLLHSCFKNDVKI